MQIPKEGQTGKLSPEPLRQGNDSVLGGEHARKKEVRWEVIQIILES